MGPPSGPRLVLYLDSRDEIQKIPSVPLKPPRGVTHAKFEPNRPSGVVCRGGVLSILPTAHFYYITIKR